MLLKAIKLPREIAVVRSPVHTKSSNKIERNNKVTRSCSQVGLKWTEVLGIVLWDTEILEIPLTNLQGWHQQE